MTKTKLLDINAMAWDSNAIGWDSNAMVWDSNVMLSYGVCCKRHAWTDCNNKEMIASISL